MAVYTLFDSDTTPANQESVPMVALTGDLGRMPRERRLALYVGACRVLGLVPEAQPLRFVRCNDGTLRLSMLPSQAESVRDRLAVATPLSFLRGGRPTSGDRSMLRGGIVGSEATGIAYDIDLGSGHLSVARVITGEVETECVAESPRRKARPRRQMEEYRLSNAG